MMLGAPILRRKLYQEVLERLIAAITSREFPPGSQIPSERELMLKLGVGRPAIREAMFTLEQMGLIRISHGERARVTEPTADAIIQQMSSAMVMMLAINPHGLEELKAARIDMECGLVRRATMAAGRTDILRLKEAHALLNAAQGKGDVFIAADLAFHNLIAEIAGNSLVASVLRAMLDWLSRFKSDLVSVPGAEQITLDEHERILTSIIAREPAKAANAMHDHLARASVLYRTLAAGAGREAVPVLSPSAIKAEKRVSR